METDMDMYMEIDKDMDTRHRHGHCAWTSELSDLKLIMSHVFLDWQKISKTV
jgi:hypothetical protein